MQFIILHSSSLSDAQVKVVLDAIKGTGAKFLDETQKAYLFEGDEAKVKEIIAPMIGEWSISPVRNFELS